MTDQPTAGTEAPLLHGRASDLTRRWLNLLGPLLGLALIFGIFTFLVPGGRFATYGNIESMLRQSAAVIVAALGMTFVIIAGGIDLSIASIVALSSVITARVLLWGATDIRGSTDFIAAHPFWIPTLAAAAGILCGMLCGLLNGALITGLRVAPFIITLGMMMVFRGAAKRFAGQRGQINPGDSWLHSVMAPVDQPYSWLLFPPGVWLVLLLALAMAVILNYSRFGRHVIAVGSNEQTARLCGISVSWTKIRVYMIGGLFGGLSGLLLFCRSNQGNATAVMGMELDVIAAVVIGGASLSGGRGSILGTVAGALIINVIASGCSFVPIPKPLQPWLDNSTVGLPSDMQEVLTGLIIIAAVALDRLRQHHRD